MATVELYTFRDADGCDESYSTFNPREAEEHAKKWKLECTANEYEYSDSEVVWDFTGKEDRLTPNDGTHSHAPDCPYRDKGECDCRIDEEDEEA